MGERKAPPNPSATAPSSSNTVLSRRVDKDITRESLLKKWPPQGWPMFACITHTSGTSSMRDKATGNDIILKYELNIADDNTYTLEIYSGIVAGDGAFTLTPAMGIRFTEQDDDFDDNPQRGVLDIHVQGQQLIPERGLILRLILAMTFMISRIDRGITPNLKRVLKTYQL